MSKVLFLVQVLGCLVIMGMTIGQDFDCVGRNCVLLINMFILRRVFFSKYFFSNFSGRDFFF